MDFQENTVFQKPDNSKAGNIIDCSEEFKLEMENSIYNYFSKLKLNDDQSVKSINRNETLIDNEKKEVEYITPNPSLNGISDFMINQIFSTDKIIPIESEDEESKLETEFNDGSSATENGKIQSCSSDVTLNDNSVNLEKEEVEAFEKEEKEVVDNIIEDEEYISKSFAVEFIDLLNINMKELNSKNDDFHVIGLKKTVEEKENTEEDVILNNINENNEIKFKNEVENKHKAKKCKHISIFNLKKRPTIHLYRSKSISTPRSEPKAIFNSSSDSLDKLSKKSGSSKYCFSNFLRNVKKRIKKY